MAKSNRDRVGEVLDALRQGLGPYVLREYKQVYKGAKYLQEIELTLNSSAYSAPHLPDEAAALDKVDVQGWLSLMWRNWNEVFKDRLGQTERNYVSELIGHRNDWAHQKPISAEDAYRCADTGARLLESVNAPAQAIRVKGIAADLLRLRFEDEQKKSVRQTGALESSTLALPPGLKPWRQVVKPHPDVASGRYVQAEFAADLAQVVAGTADPEYGDPAEFFRRTYLTEGLRDLLVTGILRLTGQGGDPVVQLQTSFGGGKTHSMLALYHLFSGKIGFSNIPGGETITRLVPDVDDRIVANRAVIVGTAFSATEPRVYADVTTHTLWGDIAWQLGGVAGYKLVETADLSGASPGADPLVKLLEEYGPALIIVDELVAFARNLYGVSERLPAGTFDSVMTFMQSLTEAVKRSSDSMLLVSIPESNIEIGGEGGRAALAQLSHTIGRVESVWKPVTARESFEVVRRRLFSGEVDYAARDAVIAAYREMYAGSTQDFPRDVSSADYVERMKAAYPIHPEMFDRLYEDWSTLERFQRTRGVLRLLSAVIHRLWADNDQSLLIMPGFLPLWTPTVRNELTRYLPDTWPAIIDADIDGDGSRPLQLDQTVQVLGQRMAARRVARAIFLASAPAAGQDKARGAEEVRIRLAVLQPGEPAAIFGDALRRMTQQLMYLYNDGNRYWYDTKPTVNRMAQDRAQNMSPDAVYMEAIRRLRGVPGNRSGFAAVHVAPQSSGEVIDEARARLVVLSPEHSHRRSAQLSPAQEQAGQILLTRGNSQRLYRNMLVFLAADEDNAAAWEAAIRDYLAWKSITDEADPLNLDAQQRKQVGVSLARANDTVDIRLKETYQWLLVPAQPEPTGEIVIEAHRIQGQDSYYDRAARRLRQDGTLIPAWSPDGLASELDRFNLWGGEAQIALKKLWEYLASYPFLPRLHDETVLMDAVKVGVSRFDAPFAYATGQHASGDYSGLAFREPLNTVYFDDRSLLVQAAVAEAQKARQMPPPGPGPGQPQPPTSFGGGQPPTGPTWAPEPPAPAPPPRTTRFYGRVAVNPGRPIKELEAIVNEVIGQLTQHPDAEVSITLEVQAQRTQGFDEATVRTVSENSRTLKFQDFGFEEE